MRLELTKTFFKIKWKIRFISFINWLIEFYIYFSIIYIIDYFFRLNIGFNYLFIPPVLALILSILKPIKDRDIALIVDKDLNLKERVITTLEFQHSENPLISNLIADTMEKLKSINLRNVYPFKFRKRLLYAGIIPVLVLFSLFIYQSIQFSKNVSVVEEPVISEKGREIVSLAQQLKFERPEIAKRLESLGKKMEEKKISQKETMSTLDKITKEIDKEPNSSSNAKSVNSELKKILELTTSKLAMDNNSSRAPQETSSQGKESSESKEKGNEKGDKGSMPKDSGPNSGTDNSSGTMDKNNMSNPDGGENTGTSQEKISEPPLQGGSTEKSIGVKERGEGTGKEEDTVREGGSLPGKGERENKLGEETERKDVQGIPQFVPGIPKGEGDIKMKIKGLGKITPSNISEMGGAKPKKSFEDPLAKEPIPPEYRDTIRLYFEKLEGER